MGRPIVRQAKEEAVKEEGMRGLVEGGRREAGAGGGRGHNTAH